MSVLRVRSIAAVKAAHLRVYKLQYLVLVLKSNLNSHISVYLMLRLSLRRVYRIHCNASTAPWPRPSCRAFYWRDFGSNRETDNKDKGPETSPTKKAESPTQSMVKGLVSGTRATVNFFLHPTLIPKKMNGMWASVKDVAKHYWVLL